MKKLSENPIDQYFREMLKSPDLKYNKQDWKGLEKMLPAKFKKKGLAWWLPASVAAAVLLLFASLWLFNKPAPEQLVKTGKQTLETGLSDKTSPSGTTAPVLSDADPVFPKNENKTAQGKPPQAWSGRKDVTKYFSGDKPPGRLHLGAGEKKVIVDQETASRFIGISPKQFSPLESLQAANAELISQTALIEVNIIPAESANLKKDQKAIIPENLNSRFSLGLSISPDINSVSNFNKSSFGSSIGIGAGYRISPRFSIRTAIAYSKKIYSALPSEYKAPWASSTAGKYAKSIDADCRVLDIPLNLNYNFIHSPKQTFFASAGLSSYFMLKEKYTLINGNSQPGYPAYPNSSYAYKNQNNHLLSVVNLSVGMIKPLNKQASLAVEPYARLPLTGIGQGKVNLQSVGVNFQLQYNLRKKAQLSPSSLNAAQ